MAAPRFPVDASLTVTAGQAICDPAIGDNAVNTYALQVFSSGTWSTVTTNSLTDTYGPIAKDHADYIASIRNSDGGYIDTGVTWQQGNYLPYFGAYYTWALMDAGDLSAARGYIENFMDHTEWPDYAGINGTIYHLTYASFTDMSPTTSGDYDSCDSLGAVFLWVLDRYIAAGGDMGWTSCYSGPGGRSFRTVLDAIADSSVYTLMANNLCRGKHYHNGELFGNQMTMDNAEVWQGCVAAANIYTYLGDASAATVWTNRGAAILAAIDSVLWRSSSNTYYTGWEWYLNAPSADTSWPYWAAVFASWVGVGNQARWTACWDKLKTVYPNWLTRSWSATYQPNTPYELSLTGAMAGNNRTDVLAWLANYTASFAPGDSRSDAVHSAKIVYAAKWLNRQTFTHASITASSTYRVVATDASGNTAILGNPLVLGSPFAISGRDITASDCPSGTRTSAAGSVYSARGGTVKLAGDDAARFSLSASGTSWASTLDVTAGTSTIYFGVTPETGDTTLSATLGVPK